MADGSFHRPRHYDPAAHRYQTITQIGSGFFGDLFKKAAISAARAAATSAGEHVKQAALEQGKKLVRGKGFKVNPAALPPKSGLPSEADLVVAEARAAKAEQRRAITEPVNTTFVKIPKRPQFLGDVLTKAKGRARRQAAELSEVQQVGDAMTGARLTPAPAGGAGLYRASGRGLYRA